MDDWWRGAVIYQIYPRSFFDSNGDGIGDLPGVADRLDHVASLGVDAIWLSPFFVSPMKDFGYDVADHCGVDPSYGTLADFDRMVERAHALGLKVLIDQVWGHTSDRHPWFLESCADSRGAKADWYVWADARPDGTPPNNWLSVFGGPAWRWDPRRRQYYLHHFLASQPKLNLCNPAVLDALVAVGAFWLDRGVDGFRLDAVDFLMHDLDLRDNPPRPPPGGVTPVKPFGLQRHVHDMAGPGTLDVMRRIRRLVDAFPGSATLAEVSSEHDPLLRAAAYTGGDHPHLHMAYTLGLMKAAFDADHMRAAIAAVERVFEGGGWMCWAFSNHDVERVASRWGDGSPAFAKLAMALLFCLRGSVCLYQGEELGLPQAELPFACLQDPYGINFWPQFKGRDGSRTPMPWQEARPHAGFTTGRPWLPVSDDHRRRAVDAQEADPDSPLAFCRRFLAWRRRHPALRRGSLTLVDGGPDVVAFERRHGGERLLCLFNACGETRRVPVEGGWRLVEGQPFPAALIDGGVALAAWGAAFLRAEGG